jgi:hypothetical protein
LAVLADAKCKEAQCETEARSVIALWNRDPKLRAEDGQFDQVKDAAIRLLKVAREPSVIAR